MFWGWRPYIASFGHPKGGTGHAVCFSYEVSGGFPARYSYYTLKGAVAWDCTPLPDGKYIVIDYEHVGELSNAIPKGWVLRWFYIPKKYGEPECKRWQETPCTTAGKDAHCIEMFASAGEAIIRGDAAKTYMHPG